MEKLEISLKNTDNKEFTKSKLGNYSLSFALIGFIILKIINFDPVHFKFIDLLTLIFEAAVVGAIADWYAVTALFRHPLNIKIPHTNILAKKKDEIADGISSIMKDFLPHNVIKQHLEGINFSDLIEKNLFNESLTLEFKGKTKAFISNFLNESKKGESHEKRLVVFINYLKTLDYSKTVAKFGLAFVNSKSYEKTLFTLSLVLEKLISKNKATLSAKVEDEIKGELPFIMKMFANGKGALVIEKCLIYIRELKNPHSNISAKIKEEIEIYCFELETDIEKSRDLNEKIYDILSDEKSKENFMNFLSTSIEKLIEYTKNPQNNDFDRFIDTIFVNLKNNFLGDEAKKASINLWITDFLFNLIEEHSLIEKSSLLIKSEITKLSEDEFINFIEKNVYNDLQYIRLNGAVVGGLGGAIIYLIQVIISLFL